MSQEINDVVEFSNNDEFINKLPTTTNGTSELFSLIGLKTYEFLNSLFDKLELCSVLALKLGESFNELAIAMQKIINSYDIQAFENRLSIALTLIADSLQSFIEKSFEYEPSIHNIMVLLAELQKFDYSDIEDEFSVNDLELEISDLQSIKDLQGIIQNKITNKKLTLETLLEILNNKYLEFKDANPCTAKLLKYLICTIVVPLILTVVGGIIVAKLLVSPNNKSVYREIHYNINNNYYIELDSVPYYTQVEIYEKNTDILLNSGYLSKRKLSEIKKMEETYKNV